jgi:hypothetical protein
MSTSPMGANKSIEDIEAALLFRKRPLLSGGKGSDYYRLIAHDGCHRAAVKVEGEEKE